MDGGEWRRRVMVEVLVARWGTVVLVMDGAEAHHHASLAVAAAGGEEDLVRGREMEMPGPEGIEGDG